MDSNPDSKKKNWFYICDPFLGFVVWVIWVLEIHFHPHIWLSVIPRYAMGVLGTSILHKKTYMVIYDPQICHGCGGDIDFTQKSKVLDAK